MTNNKQPKRKQPEKPVTLNEPETKPASTAANPEGSFWSKFRLAVLGGLIGSVIPSVITLYVTQQNIQTNRVIMTANNLQRDKEEMIRQLNGVTNCYVTFVNEIAEEPEKFDIRKLYVNYTRQFEFTNHLVFCAPDDICWQTGKLNQAYLGLMQALDQEQNLRDVDVRGRYMRDYTKAYYEWLGFIRKKMIELNLTTMPEMSDSTFMFDPGVYRQVK